jgi:hypothetical protein
MVAVEQTVVLEAMAHGLMTMTLLMAWQRPERLLEAAAGEVNMTCVVVGQQAVLTARYFLPILLFLFLPLPRTLVAQPNQPRRYVGTGLITHQMRPVSTSMIVQKT